MARQIDCLLVIKGELLAETPIHVGGAGSAVDTDLPLALDGSGRYYIPGTSLAGAIRSWLDRADTGPKAEGDNAPGQGASRRLWGHGPRSPDAESANKSAGEGSQSQRGRDKELQGIASRVIVHDAYLKGIVASEIRDHVGIDRASGTAATGIKYDRQILPKGTRFHFCMEVELAEWESARRIDRQPAFERTMDADRKRIANAVDALCSGGIRFGGAKTRGLGRLCLDDAIVVEHETKSPAGILDLVRTRGGDAAIRQSEASAFIEKEGITANSRNTPPTLHITIKWQPDGPVMVKSSSDGLGVDMLPLVSGIGGGNLSMVIPGSAIKGRLRSQAERIALTLGLDWPQAQTTAVTDGQNKQKLNRDAFQDQLARVPLVATLFGIPGPKTRSRGAEDPETRGLGLGAVMIDDCFAENRAVAPKQWEKLVAAPKDKDDGMDHVRAALLDMAWARSGAEQSKDDPRISDDPAAHVAIDRWTGGAADGMLYSALEPRGVEWAPIKIEMALDRLKAPPRSLEQSNIDRETWHGAAVALFFMTMRDFALGHVPLGFGGNRGYGAVKVTEISFHWQGTKDPLLKNIALLDGLKIEDEGSLSDATKLQGLQESWSRYLKAWGDQQQNSNAGSQQ